MRKCSAGRKQMNKLQFFKEFAKLEEAATLVDLHRDESLEYQEQIKEKLIIKYQKNKDVFSKTTEKLIDSIKSIAIQQYKLEILMGFCKNPGGKSPETFFRAPNILKQELEKLNEEKAELINNIFYTKGITLGNEFIILKEITAIEANNAEFQGMISEINLKNVNSLESTIKALMFEKINEIKLTNPNDIQEIDRQIKECVELLQSMVEVKDSQLEEYYKEQAVTKKLNYWRELREGCREQIINMYQALPRQVDIDASLYKKRCETDIVGNQNIPTDALMEYINKLDEVSKNRARFDKEVVEGTKKIKLSGVDVVIKTFYIGDIKLDFEDLKLECINSKPYYEEFAQEYANQYDYLDNIKIERIERERNGYLDGLENIARVFGKSINLEQNTNNHEEYLDEEI